MGNQSNTTEIRRLSACSFAEAVKIWNEGFQGYFVDMTLSLDGYLSRLTRDGLSPENSLVACCDGRPAGFLLNGFRESARGKLAWNGGTGVAPEFRGRGVGKALMRATLDLYDELGVDIAMLEAISTNEAAIGLYQQYGYKIVDRLISLRHEGRLPAHSFARQNGKSYAAESVAPAALAQLEFYDELAPWQSHWQSLSRNQGEALIVSDSRGVACGYALYKKTYDEQGRVSTIALYQCVARPGAEEKTVATCALQTLFAPFDLECRRSTYNLSESNEAVSEILVEAGFDLYIEQVHMVRRVII
ncbi:MAG TPA: GNAT family N-acetyltransferase [Pyrinomonadaceae bacterium]|jgi:ribosomal protein S18 acetylase RimI-like enzyme|nr:GNAT family N-acetyltransferase [Pyrinomonadaceae bacterium]